MKLVIPFLTILLLAFLFGTVNAAEVHKNGFGGITPLNTTGLTVFNDSQKRSFEYESDSLVLSAEFSILETNGDIRDFSLFDNDLTRQNSTPSQEPEFVNSIFRTALETTPYVDSSSINDSSTADAMVDEDNPTSNFGTTTTVIVRTLDTSRNRRTFAKWDVSSIPSTAIITNAIMWLYKDSDTGPFPRTYEAQAVSANWVEVDITWNTQPGVIGSPVTIIVTDAEDIWYGWNVTIFVQNWVDGTWTNNGIRIKDSVEGAASVTISVFHSRENTNDPSLSISYYNLTGGQWANASHSETLDMETTNVSMVWWGQTRQTGLQYITGKGCSSTSYVYGLYLESDNTLSAFLADNTCSWDTIQTGLPSGGLDTDRTYGIGAVFENNTWGMVVHLWLDGEWIYNETSTETVGDTSSDYYIGRSSGSSASTFLNGTTDEVLVFKERLSNDTMKLLTTKQHDIVIKSGPRTTTQGFEGLFFALPWIIVFGLLGWLGYIIFRVWKEAITRE